MFEIRTIFIPEANTSHCPRKGDVDKCCDLFNFSDTNILHEWYSLKLMVRISHHTFECFHMDFHIPIQTDVHVYDMQSSNQLIYNIRNPFNDNNASYNMWFDHKKFQLKVFVNMYFLIDPFHIRPRADSDLQRRTRMN